MNNSESQLQLTLRTYKKKRTSTNIKLMNPLTHPPAHPPAHSPTRPLRL